MSGHVIFWDGGRFSVPVYEALIASRNIHLHDWDALVWEQIIRQMARENEHIDPILYDIASEGCLCGPCNK